MELWYPPKDRPHLFEWWRPLVLASRAARLERVPWPIHVDEMILRGRVDRAGRPAIWVYRHPEARELYLDHTGQPYRFTRTPKAKGVGRFTPCDIRAAIWRAGLPEVVEPIFYRDEERPAPTWGYDEVPVHDGDGGDGRGLPAARHGQGSHPAARTARSGGASDVTGGAAEPPARRQRGHLTVIDGGRSLAG